MIRLHDVFASPFARRVSIALEEKGLRWERVVHSYDECDAPDFPHPFHVTPVLEIDGLMLFDSLAILEYLEETRALPRLLPEDRALRARARAFAVACEMELRMHYARINPQLREPREKWDVKLMREGIAGIEASVAALEPCLAGREWLVGDAFSIADLSWAPFIANTCEIGLRPLLDRAPAVRAWTDRLLARPSVAATRILQPHWKDIPADWLSSVR